MAACMAASMCLLGTGKTVNAAWAADSTGWWWTEGGGYPVNEWRMIDGSWYWFDGTGYMAAGWQVINGSWYYMYSSGAMAHDCWIGSYYVGSDGAWIPGYSNSGWLQSGSRWWYRHADGSYTRNGWELINGSWYYFDAAGWMLSDTWIGNYYVGASGAMAADTYTPDGYYVNADGVWTPVWHPAEYKEVKVVDQKAWTEERTMYVATLHDLCTGCGIDLDQAFIDTYGLDAYLDCLNGTFTLAYKDSNGRYIATKETMTFKSDFNSEACEKLRAFFGKHESAHMDKGEPSGDHSADAVSHHPVKTETIEHPEVSHTERVLVREGYWK